MTFPFMLRLRASWTIRGRSALIAAWLGYACICMWCLVQCKHCIPLPLPLPVASCSFWLRFAWPWRKVAKNSVLDVTLEGEIPEKKGSRFSSTLSVSELCDALQKAAVDPRIRSVCVTVKPLSIGWGKVLEIRRHLQHFRSVERRRGGRVISKHGNNSCKFPCRLGALSAESLGNPSCRTWRLLAKKSTLSHQRVEPSMPHRKPIFRSEELGLEDST